MNPKDGNRRGEDVARRAVQCEVRGCMADAVGMLRYRNPGSPPIDHPLCGPHGNPSFHLRDLDSPAWTWEPIDEVLTTTPLGNPS